MRSEPFPGIGPTLHARDIFPRAQSKACQGKTLPRNRKMTLFQYVGTHQTEVLPTLDFGGPGD
jgi:hypothetical protein